MSTNKKKRMAVARGKKQTGATKPCNPHTEQNACGNAHCVWNSGNNMAQIAPFCGGQTRENTYKHGQSVDFDAFVATICSQSGRKQQTCVNTGVCSYAADKNQRCQPKQDSFQESHRRGQKQTETNTQNNNNVHDPPPTPPFLLDVWFHPADVEAQQCVVDGNMSTLPTTGALCRREIRCLCPMESTVRRNQFLRVPDPCIFTVDYTIDNDATIPITKDEVKKFTELKRQIEAKRDNEATRIYNEALSHVSRHRANPDDVAHPADLQTNILVLQYYKGQLKKSTPRRIHQGRKKPTEKQLSSTKKIRIIIKRRTT